MSKILVAVLVYDRIPNIENWARCWQLSDVKDAQLVVIHNYRDQYHKTQLDHFCQSKNIAYIPRMNNGFDIGAFQDICRGRLPRFNFDFDYLLWCTDDLLPVRPSFITEYREAMQPGVIAACYEVSVEPHPHIRTTGFMLHRDTLPRIRFLVDPILTKVDCYNFEHRHPTESLIDQVSRWGRVVQVGDIEQSPMWDSGLNSMAARRRSNRRRMEQRIFKRTRW